MLKFLKGLFNRYNKESIGVGIDLGLKEYATCSDGSVYHHFNKTYYVKDLEKRIPYMTKSNANKAMLELYKYRCNCIEKIVDDIIKKNYTYIVIEDLHFKNMNKNIQKALDDSLFHHFKYYLTLQCKANGIELRMVRNNFPSSKLCSKCGNKKNDLKLSDRTYICSKCGLHIDRDLNASINLLNATVYYKLA